MRRMRSTFSLLIAALLGATCARNREATAGGEVISPSDANATVVLHVQNLGLNMVELRSIEDGRSRFIGAVSGQDTASVLLDPLLFPTASLFIAAYAQAPAGATRSISQSRKGWPGVWRGFIADSDDAQLGHPFLDEPALWLERRERVRPPVVAERSIGSPESTTEIRANRVQQVILA